MKSSPDTSNFLKKFLVCPILLFRASVAKIISSNSITIAFRRCLALILLNMGLYMYICVCVLSHFGYVWLFATLWTVVPQAPLSTGFSRQEYWSGVPFPPPGDLPDLGIKSASLKSPALAGGFFTSSTTWEAPKYWYICTSRFFCAFINHMHMYMWTPMNFLWTLKLYENLKHTHENTNYKYCSAF